MTDLYALIPLNTHIYWIIPIILHVSGNTLLFKRSNLFAYVVGQSNMSIKKLTTIYKYFVDNNVKANENWKLISTNFKFLSWYMIKNTPLCIGNLSSFRLSRLGPLPLWCTCSQKLYNLFCFSILWLGTYLKVYYRKVPSPCTLN